MKRIFLLLVVLGGLSGVSTQGVSAEAKPEPRQQIAQLIRQLGDRDYAVREKAENDLKAIGADALDALETASDDKDLEIATRARYLTRFIQSEWLTKGASEDVREPLKDYLGLNGSQRLARIRKIGATPDGKGVPALCRLVRFEQSEQLAKYAAVEIWKQFPTSEPPGERIAAAIRTELNTSTRTPSRWLATWLKFSADAPAALKEWTRWVDDEVALFRQTPSKSSSAVVTELVLVNAAQLTKANRRDESLAALQKLLDVEQGDQISLLRMAELLGRQKAWPVLEEIGRRFPLPVSKYPPLAYLIAKALAEQGKGPEAEKAAAKARETNQALYPGKEEHELNWHLTVADYLAQWGMFSWAEQEYRFAIAKSGKQRGPAIVARVRLASMFHDLEQDFKAAELLKEVVELPRIWVMRTPDNAVENPGLYAGQMHYYYACHWLSQKDLAKHRQALEQCLAADPTNIDGLIATYRLSEASPEHRKRVQDLIAKCAAKMRSQMAAKPYEALSCNNLAWLIANTEGDLEEALRLSKRAVELAPKSGGYYDTLGRVYFARNDLDNAVKYQRKALEITPYSPEIARQLRLFEAARDQRKKPG